MAGLIGRLFRGLKTSPSPHSRTATPTTLQVVAAIRPSIVEISTVASDPIGSGFFYERGGWVATNAHVVRGLDSVVVTLSDGSHSIGDVVGRHEGVDLAVVHAKARR